MGYIWNQLGRLNGGRHTGKKVNKAAEPLNCPQCGQMGRYHITALPKWSFCDHLDCAWRSCTVCRITWSVRTGSVIPIQWVPPKAA